MKKVRPVYKVRFVILSKAKDPLLPLYLPSHLSLCLPLYLHLLFYLSFPQGNLLLLKTPGVIHNSQEPLTLVTQRATATGRSLSTNHCPLASPET